MSAEAVKDQLALARALTARTNELCAGLEEGTAALLDEVTPTTQALLQWWFAADQMAARGRLNFHAGQRQAILNTIVAHEVLAETTESWTLADLYAKVAPAELDARRHELAATKHQHPKYCMKMATGTGKTWVLQALLIWQFLNKSAAIEAGYDDPRFTRNFLIVTPGLIVYERMLDAFCGKLVDGGSGERDFNTSDLMLFADLFIPEDYREQVIQFVRNSVCAKADIARKTTGGGLIAITNWHLLAGHEDEDSEPLPEAETLDPAASEDVLVDPAQVVAGLLPLTPGKAKGNSLDVLDARYARGGALARLAELSELVVFNDEAHHIHEFKREGEATEVEWQKSLMQIAANKQRRFVQIDFSATPYNDVGSGKNRAKRYFPHIIVDFDLLTAMKNGLVKSLVLDKRREVAAIKNLSFTCDRDEAGRPTLSEGQRVMLRAGLTKLRSLERGFAHLDPNRRPKMLVVCEDTAVTPLIAAFLTMSEQLEEDDVLTIDSGKKTELGEKQWSQVRERLFNVDRHAQPRVIVSVLMLREGFDVNNICVIVPLRSSQAQILLEQTIGRGLRLMWRDAEYDDIKRENRERIATGQEPTSLIDVLSIVEHPAFSAFYDELIKGGVASEDREGPEAPGDMITVGLRPDFANFDFEIPLLITEADEARDFVNLDVANLPMFVGKGAAELKELVGKGDVFVSYDPEAGTWFGAYRVEGAQMQAAGYNEYLQQLVRRIDAALSKPSSKAAKGKPKPYLQLHAAMLSGWIEQYIWDQLFGVTFNPLHDENWRLLLLDEVVDHVTRVFTEAILAAETTHVQGQTEVFHRALSEVPKIVVREACSIEVSKCIYTRLGWSSASGGLERDFIKWAQGDSQVLAFCKLSETRHTFLHMRYMKSDGMPAFYSPDFLVRTRSAIYVVETKAPRDMNHPDVQRKLKAAAAWCERINDLPGSERGELQWFYVLLSQARFYSWTEGNGQLGDLLDRERTQASTALAQQPRLL